jgi:phospholipid/cholesterol/gamma-HCH transport system ATP-binding protein
MGEAPRIEVKGLTMGYGERVVQSDVSFAVRAGEIFVVMGDSGCGKSTLMRHMIGLDAPRSGDVCYDGEPYWAAGEERREALKRRFGVLYQYAALFSSMTLAENVSVPLVEQGGLAPAEALAVSRTKLALVGLAGFEGHYPSEISGGMKKRAGLARALAMDPRVLFYDEPSAGLDPVTSAEIDELIIGLNKKLGVTSVVVTHEMDSAFRIADRMVLLDRGKFIVSGTPEEMKNSADPLVRQFVYGLTEGPLTDRRRAGGYETDLLAETGNI